MMREGRSMKQNTGKGPGRVVHTIENVFVRLAFVVLAIISILSFIVDIFSGRWFSAIFMGLIALMFTGCAVDRLDFRPEFQFMEKGIWFRDYGVMVPYSYMERGEYCAVPEIRRTSYEVDIFLSPAAFETGQKSFQKLQKKLKRERKIRILLFEEDREKYESLCRVLKSKIPMRDASNDPIAE